MKFYDVTKSLIYFLMKPYIYYNLCFIFLNNLALSHQRALRFMNIFLNNSGTAETARLNLAKNLSYVFCNTKNQANVNYRQKTKNQFKFSNGSSRLVLVEWARIEFNGRSESDKLNCTAGGLLSRTAWGPLHILCLVFFSPCLLLFVCVLPSV